MPQELIKEFIGKVCTIVLFNDTFGVQGKIIAVEDNWIKLEEKIKFVWLMVIWLGIFLLHQKSIKNNKYERRLEIYE